MIERELIGGECGYWACMPSKAVLRASEARRAADRAPGSGGAGPLNWEQAREFRDMIARQWDDSKQVDGYADKGAQVIKGVARLTGPHTLVVDGRELRAEHIILATGTEALTVPVDGLEHIEVWSNRELFTTHDLPERAVIVGGSAVGIESATFLASFGTHVTLVNRSNTLLSREEPRVGELAQESLREQGVDLRLGTEVARVRNEADGPVVEFTDGSSASAPVLIFAMGRTPRTADLGLEAAGVSVGKHGEVLVDEHQRAAEGIWAIGDITGQMPFTHVAKYHGRIAADAILGKPHAARHEGIPRVVFSDPQIAAVGLTQAQAAERGVRTASAELDVPSNLGGPWVYETDPSGTLGLLADADAGVLVGAWAVGPMAGEWIHYAALAVREAIPIETLLDQVAQFPSYHEAYLAALGKLDL
jgi:dihydrolipoamide dehydrogenase